jgi:hypothetical protein
MCDIEAFPGIDARDFISLTLAADRRRFQFLHHDGLAAMIAPKLLRPEKAAWCVIAGGGWLCR